MRAATLTREAVVHRFHETRSLHRTAAALHCHPNRVRDILHDAGEWLSVRERDAYHAALYRRLGTAAAVAAHVGRSATCVERSLRRQGIRLPIGRPETPVPSGFAEVR